MQLKKVVQSLIKGLILTYEASLCFFVPLIVKMDSTSIKVYALLGYRASVDRHKLSLISKKHPILVEVIDGRPLVLGDATHKTAPLDIILKGHHSIIAFNVIKSPSNLVVLGLSWLDKYNPVINQKIRRLVF
jgi:hypothetical protein